MDILYPKNSLMRRLESPLAQVFDWPTPVHTIWSNQLEDFEIFELVGGPRNGYRISLAVNDQGDWGLGYGFNFPFPAESEPLPPENRAKLYQMVASPRVRERKLLKVSAGEIPGWDPSGRHQDGGAVTRTIFAKEVEISEAPEWFRNIRAGARVFKLREGIYISFPDSCRFINPAKNFWHPVFPPSGFPIARQGDLLVYSSQEFFYKMTKVTSRVSSTFVIGRHQISAVEAEIVWDNRYFGDSVNPYSQLRFFSSCSITHPEHDELVVLPAEYPF